MPRRRFRSHRSIDGFGLNRCFQKVHIPIGRRRPISIIRRLRKDLMPATASFETQLLRLGHSPDPDDAFMFYGMAKGLIDQGPYRFEHILQDIQTLNVRARSGELEVSAISIHAYPHVADKYALMSCGASMGDDYGPMVITTKPASLADLIGKTIAIPGVMTTAFLALQLALGNAAPLHAGAERSAAPDAAPAFRYVVVEFDQIPKFVKDGKADAGL